MIPFARMVQYGNAPQVKDIVKFDTTNGSMYLLYSTGELYGLGRNTTYQMGTGTNINVSTWTLISTNVSTFWISKDGDSPILFRKKNGTWNIAGRAYIFGDTSTIYMTPTNVDDKLGVLSSGYDELYINSQNIWYRKDGRYFRMGLNANLNLLGTTSTTPITSFTEYILPSDVKAIFPGHAGTLVSYKDGSMKAIGNNNTARYGLPVTQAYTSLTAITLPEVLSVKYREMATFISTVNGTYVCGNCRYGQLGNGITDINTYVTTPQQFTASNPDSLENYSGFTVINYQGSVQYCGHNGRSGNGLSTGYASTLTPAPNILSTDFYVNVSATYYIQNNSLYATGSPGTYSLLPGYSSTQLSFVKLELP